MPLRSTLDRLDPGAAVEKTAALSTELRDPRAIPARRGLTVRSLRGHGRSGDVQEGPPPQRNAASVHEAAGRNALPAAPVCGGSGGRRGGPHSVLPTDPPPASRPRRRGARPAPPLEAHFAALPRYRFAGARPSKRRCIDAEVRGTKVQQARVIRLGHVRAWAFASTIPWLAFWAQTVSATLSASQASALDCLESRSA